MSMNFDDLFPQPRLLDPDQVDSLLRDHKNADFQHEILMEYIKEFESELNDDEEVALQLTSFGQSVLLQVTEIGYYNPSIISFYGYVNDRPAQLIQHVSQLNFLLTSAPKLDPNKPAKRIGFVSDED